MVSSEDIKKRYVVVGNSDRTEGKGRIIDFEICDDLREAYSIQQSGKYGVQGGKNCEIWEEPYITFEYKFYLGERTLLLGYKVSSGEYEWLVPNPFLIDDPEFAEFMRLKEKFKEFL